MAKNKNFKINRLRGDRKIKATDFKIGDVFEREGSLHMLVNLSDGTPVEAGLIPICNLNTGSVWHVPNTESWFEALDCEMSYRFNE